MGARSRLRQTTGRHSQETAHSNHPARYHQAVTPQTQPLIGATAEDAAISHLRLADGNISQRDGGREKVLKQPGALARLSCKQASLRDGLVPSRELPQADGADAASAI